MVANINISVWGVRIISETAKARLVSWYSVDHKRYVQAWVPKSVSIIQNGIMYTNKGIYNNLKFM